MTYQIVHFHRYATGASYSPTLTGDEAAQAFEKAALRLADGSEDKEIWLWTVPDHRVVKTAKL